MTRIFVIVLLLAALLSLSAAPVFAANCGPNVYFDQTNGDENNNGTLAAPFKTQARAQQVLTSQSAVGCVVEVLPGGKLIVRSQILPASPTTGVPLPTSVIYTLGLLLAVLLIAAGWWLQRRNMTATIVTSGK